MSGVAGIHHLHALEVSFDVVAILRLSALLDDAHRQIKQRVPVRIGYLFQRRANSLAPDQLPSFAIPAIISDVAVPVFF